MREALIQIFEKHNLNFRVFCHQTGSNTIVSETQLRLEMTSISPLGVVVYSQIKGDYQKNAKKIISSKIDRLYQNANLTIVDTNHSEINEDRLINEEQSYEDLNGYEIVNRPQKSSQFTRNLGTRASN